MKSILLMGGNQFAGKKLCEFMLNKGYKVYVLNRGNRPNPEKAEFLKCDRNMEKELTKCLKNIRVEYIIDQLD